MKSKPAKAPLKIYGLIEKLCDVHIGNDDGIVASVLNVEGLEGIRLTEDAMQIHREAVATAKKIILSYNLHDELVAALESLTDPLGHIWHGGSLECTGECKQVQAALARAKGETR